MGGGGNTCLKIFRYLKDKEFRFNVNRQLGFYSRLSDEVFIQKSFKVRYGKNINMENPETFNEKTQWLKLHDRNTLYVQMVDKYLVREHVAKVIGSEHLIPLLGVWDHVDDIDFSRLPNQFVLKCNHNSGVGLCICKDKRELNEKAVRRNLKKGMREDYYMAVGREWPYKDVPRKIIAEQYMVDESGYGLKDYKLFTFSGQVYCIEVDYDRFTDHHRNFYTREWEYMPFTTQYPTNPDHRIEKPGCLDEMVDIAEKLADSISNPAFLRVDLYCIDNRIYFGELTFYHGGGGERFYPEDYDKKLGDLIRI